MQISSGLKDISLNNTDVTTSFPAELVQMIEAEVSKGLSEDILGSNHGQHNELTIDTSILTQDRSTVVNAQQISVPQVVTSSGVFSARNPHQNMLQSTTYSPLTASASATLGKNVQQISTGKMVTTICNQNITTGKGKSGVTVSGKMYPSNDNIMGKSLDKQSSYSTQKCIPSHGKGKKIFPSKAGYQDDLDELLQCEMEAEVNGVTKVDVGIQADDSRPLITSPRKDDAAATGCTFCYCGLVDCGVTVMPGTHEKLKECCNSVVPKKRKRHMETKHVLPGVLTRRLRKTRDTSRDKEPTVSTPKLSQKVMPSHTELPSIGDIIIDLDTRNEIPENDSLANKKTKDKLSHEKSVTKKQLISQANNKSAWKSVIIQPGTSFSIPVTSSQSLPLLQLPVYVEAGGSKKPASSSGRKPLLVAGSSTVASKSAISVRLVKSNVISVQGKNMSDSQNESSMMQYSSETGIVLLQNTSEENNEDQNDQNNGSLNADEGSHGRKGKKRRYPTSKPFKCAECDHAFNQRIHLRKHQSKHTGKC